jgi:2-polyprenyl-3-methyl-5-hydroxy-6-metoxy-1,4-benzoquinol methylase
MEIIQENEYIFPYHQTVDLNGKLLYYMWDGALSYYCRYNLITDQLKNNKVKNVIEIGCGDGVIISNLAKRFDHVKFLGLDYSSRAIEHAKNFSFSIANVEFKEFDVLKRGVNSNDNDLLILTEVLEHIPLDMLSAFTEVSVQHVKSGGLIVVTVPSENKPLEDKHFQHFSKEKLINLFNPYCVTLDIFEIAPRKSYIAKFLRIALLNKFYMLKPGTRLYEWLLNKYFKKFSKTNCGNGIFAVFKRI